MNDKNDVRARSLERAPFFNHIAQSILQRFPSLKSESYFRNDTPLILAEAYFLLSDSYKSIRNNKTLTDDYKKSAISAVAVMVVRPFEPISGPENIDSLTLFLSNPMMALGCANAWAADRNLFEHYPHDYLKRFYITLDNIRIPSLDPFIDFKNGDLDEFDYSSFSLTREEISVLDDWVLKIHMLVNQKR